MDLLRTENKVSSLVLRLALGFVIFPHGAQKVLPQGIQDSLGMGGHGLSGTLALFTEQMNIPFVFAVLAITAEFFGSLGLIFGLMTRVAAFGIACDMAAAAYLVHWDNGFFMNWYSLQPGEGFEYHILAIGIAVALMITGGGAASIDGVLARKKSS
jgi:putative oxidoreductase